MHAEIIAVGTEILLGQIVNTNATFVAKRLADMGIDVYFESVVGDNESRLLKEIKKADSRSDLVILIGGLGPTKDDLTKQTVAKFLGKRLIEDSKAMNKIVRYYHETGKTMTENNKLQALFIEDSIALKNETGFAVGNYFKNANGTDFLLLPGPPSEMKPMFVHQAQPILQEAYFNDHLLFSRVLRFFGIGESLLVTKLEDLIDGQTNPTIAPYAKTSEVTLRLTASSKSEDEAVNLLDQLELEIAKRVGEFMYGYGDDNSLVAVIVEQLKKKKLTISAAESLTAGEFQSTLGSISGVSEVFLGGVVTYSNKAKEQLLNVSHDTLLNKGAVSEETAKEMATSVRTKLGTDIGISFTGVAGPTELEGQPVGTVWIGLSIKGKETTAKLYHFSSNRYLVRERAVLSGLDYIRKSL
ncbi:competence/damage-inducible protein A [Liquorilactobacillus cacaonum]|uniref:Putative competence-damage inducible protein n=1 Tax=Liquorilactobacillus cacaonum DSM 21116 TaxID=1423729 RepID=A0A0R2CK57_9LACO|nr:competence/damage-inducible protein A [Liquorilactobacillus cacaonum]KRM90356.1 competence damage-inducible protein A [Liquorilactobacillus cacaonum DSM 21116]